MTEPSVIAQATRTLLAWTEEHKPTILSMLDAANTLAPISVRIPLFTLEDAKGIREVLQSLPIRASSSILVSGKKYPGPCTIEEAQAAEMHLITSLDTQLDFSGIPGLSEATNDEQRWKLIETHLINPLRANQKPAATPFNANPWARDTAALVQLMQNYDLRCAHQRGEAILAEQLEKQALRNRKRKKSNGNGHSDNHTDHETAKTRAQHPQPFKFPDHVEAGIKYLEGKNGSPPHDQEDQAKALAHAARLLAATLVDVRDETTLDAGRVLASDRNAIIMQRKIAHFLLSEDNLWRAANAMQIPKAFGTPPENPSPPASQSPAATKTNDKKKISPAETRIRSQLKTHIDYLSRPHVQEFLLTHTQTNPSVALLLQASLLPTLEECSKQSTNYLASGHSLNTTTELLATHCSPDIEEPKTARHRRHSTLPLAQNCGQTWTDTLSPRNLGQKSHPITQFHR